MNLFKPSDFVLIANRGQNSAIEIAEASNRILNEWLSKEGTRVYGLDRAMLAWHEQPAQTDTHTALLIDVREIERECEHKNVGLMMEKKGFRCVDCSAEIKPKEGWERV